MVVQRDIDLEHFESSDLFKGFYFVLGGTVPIGKQDDIPLYVRIPALLNLIKEYSEHGLTEIILALHINPEGEQTADIVDKKIQEIYPDLKITKLGRGLSTGSEIEYADKDTLKSALDNRK
jgi:recombination protein RecR